MEKKIFNRIALAGRAGVEGVSDTLTALKNYLLSLDRQVIFLEKSLKLVQDHESCQGVKPQALHDNADLLIVVGGDGSMLNASHIAAPINLPVLGVNRGHLGFLTDINPNDLTKIHAILDGYYRIEKRFMLSAIVGGSTTSCGRLIALNDVVLLPGNAGKMIEFEIYINDEFVCSQRADGLIIATPTGSTAYALSGGGPILHTQLDAITLVPMFPHTLSSRPIVVQGNSHVRVLISKNNEVSPQVSGDGRNPTHITPGCHIDITKYQHQLRLVHPEDYNYFDTLRCKLDWQKRSRRA